MSRSSGKIGLGAPARLLAALILWAALVGQAGASGLLTTMSWGSYLGGGLYADGRAVAVDGAGNICVAGRVLASQWTTTGAFYVSKLTPQGQLLWSTPLPALSASNDTVNAMALDASGNIFLTGTAGSQQTVFVDKLTSAGLLLWTGNLGLVPSSTVSYLGQGIVVDTLGNACVAGTKHTVDPLGSGIVADQAFVAKASANGQSTVWYTELNPANNNDHVEAFGIARDGSNNLFVTGDTNTEAWLMGTLGTHLNGAMDAFVSRLTAAGAPEWSACLGGAGDDAGQRVAVDHDGNVAVTGWTQSASWATGGYDTTYHGNQDGFAAKITGNGLQLVWSTYLGGAQQEMGRDIAVDQANNILVTGYTLSSGWAQGGFDTTLNSADAFVAKLAPAGQHLWSGYLGGTAAEDGLGIAIGPDGGIYVAGATASSAWLAGGYETTFDALHAYAGVVNEPFLVKIKEISQLLVTINPPAAVADGARWRRVGTSTWQDSGTTETGILPGSQVIEFKPTANWNTPTTQSVTIPVGVTALTSGTYVRQTGSVCVVILPDTAVAAGAQWRRSGTTAWFDSGTTETDVPTGSYPIEFKPVTGWNLPSFAMPAIISNGNTDTVVGLYSIQSGYLCVNITPPRAVSAGAAWRRVGTSAWQGSGGTEFGVPIGSYSVEFCDLGLLGWNRPASIPALVTYQATTTLGAAYDARVVTATLSSAAGDPVTGPFTVQAAFAVPVQGFTTTTLTTTNAVVTNYHGLIVLPSFSAGSSYSLATRTTGTAKGWGTFGADYYSIPGVAVSLYPLGGGIARSGGLQHDARLNIDGTVSIGGNNDYGQRNVPAGLSGVINVAAGANHTLALKADGTVVAWGENNFGQCNVPAGLAGVLAVAGGTSHSLALKADGTVVAWGDNSRGQCTVPAGLSGVVAIAAGRAHSLALKADGTVVAWGDNGSGQCTVPAGLSGVAAISTALNHNLALRSDGTVAAWGSNLYGESTVPPTLGTVAAVSAGYYHNLALKADGSMTAWGDNSYGQCTVPPGLVVSQPALVRCQFDLIPLLRVPVSVQVPAGAGMTLGGVSTVASNVLQRNSTFAAEGSVRVAIVPPEAVAAGAQWQRAGASGWHDSGALESAVTIGSQTVQFKAIAGWDSPTSRSVTVNLGATALTTGTYVRQTGSLSVVLVPAGARAAGAQWQRAGTAVWHDSGATETNLPTGDYQINFKAAAGWNTPNSLTVTVGNGATALTTGTYMIPTGSLAVTLAPPEAVAAGARWRRVGQSAWRDGATTESSIPIGSEQVQFLAVAGWDAPATQNVTIANGLTTSTSGLYVRQTGFLSVTITPPAAVAAGARWRRVGTTAWLASGATESNVPTAGYTVEFLTLANWASPATQPVTVSASATATASGAYLIQPGALAVTIAPPGAAAAGGKWRRVGTAPWWDGGTTETLITAGLYQVQFLPLPGWDSPTTPTVTVVDGLTTSTTGVYVRQTGSLAVTITPPAAVAAGARWRRAGTLPWYDSGTTESAVPTGADQVEFKPVSGWDAPTTQSVTILNGLTTSTTGLYVPSTGSLAVRIEPPEAAVAGARWRRTGTTTWLTSGYLEVGIAGGVPTVEFKAISGWDAPPSQNITVRNGAVASTIATYARQTGSLRVTITPPAAVAAGARWRCVNYGPWINSGSTESNIPTGDFEVEFSAATGWNPPSRMSVTINPAATTAVSNAYVQQRKTLVVNIEPQAATTAGAKWRRVGTSTWIDTGVAEVDLPAGDYTVEFKDVTGWDLPARQNVTIDGVNLATFTGTYVRSSGSLTVLIDPAGAVADGAKWRRAGTTAWMDSGATATGVPIGDCSIEFMTIAGWYRPAFPTLTITKNVNSTVSGTYQKKTAVRGDSWMRYE